MALELIGGAALKAVLGELLKAVWHAKDKASSFQPILTGLESTLKAIFPRLEQISSLNKNLDLQLPQMEELVALVNKGTELVLKCSKISTINFVRRLQYSKELHDLDSTLLRYFVTILALDHYRNDLEVLVMVKELHTKLVGDDKIDGGIGIQSESSKPNKDSGRSGVNEYEKLYQDYKNKEAVKLHDDSRVGEANKSIQKKEEINQSRMIIENRPGMKLFLLKECPYELHVEDIFSCIQSLGTKTYAIGFENYELKFGKLMLKRLTVEMKVGEEDFKTRIEELGKVGKSPNILPPIGAYFSEIAKFLIYDFVPAGSLHSLLHGPKWYPCAPKVLDWNSTLKITLGVARGINHLHSVKFVHGNIKSSNVLLTKDLDGCISDYGLASIMKFSIFDPPHRGYHAPEFIKSEEATQKSDVYSFGVMLLEVLTGKKPYGVNFPRQVCLKVQKEGASSIFSVKLLKYNCIKEMSQILQIALQCVEEEPERRSEMNDVTMMIENILQKKAPLAQSKDGLYQEANDAKLKGVKLFNDGLYQEANDAKLKGVKLFNDGLYQEALSQYEPALHVAPGQMLSSSNLRCTSYVNRGICFLKLGKYEDTITECNKALKMNPNDFRALIKRGEANEKLQNFAWAIADMETAIRKLDPTDVKSKNTEQRLVAEVMRLKKILVGPRKYAKSHNSVCLC